MNNYKDTILSQYANATALVSLLDSFNTAVDPSVNIDSLYNNVINIATAIGYGLDVWGRIVQIGRNLKVAIGGYNSFAYNTEPCNFGGFSAYSLNDNLYRTVILTKALSNISRTTIPNMNAIVMKLLGNRGILYYADTGGMAVTLHFNFLLYPYEIALITTTKTLTKPSGVYLNFASDI